MRRAGVMAVLPLLALGACAAGDDAPPAGDGPRRPLAEVPDGVMVVDRELLIGRWSCREVNPYPGRPPQAQTIEFGADGKGRNTALVDMGAQGGPVPGRMALDFAYDWRVDGERVAVTGVRTTARAADGSAATGVMASVAQFVINRFSNQLKPGLVDVLMLDRERLVLRNAEGSEPVPGVQDCAREA